MDGKAVTYPVCPSKMAFALLNGAILLIPLTYATKSIVGYPEIKWVNPSLILAFLALTTFLFRGHLPRAAHPAVTVGLLFAAWVWISAFMAAGLDQRGFGYSTVREPIRFSLNFLLFVLIVYFGKDTRNRERLLRMVMWVVIAECLIAIYFWLSFWVVLPLPKATRAYIEIFNLRQAWWFGSLVVPRFGGSFIEGPPLGLFAFGCLITIVHLASGRSWLRLAAIAAGIVLTIGAFSTQIFLAVMLWLAGYLLTRLRWRTTLAKLAIGSVIFLAMAGALGVFLWQVHHRSRAERYITQTRGTSIGERLWHIRYGSQLIQNHVPVMLWGVGLGRYGEEATRTGLYPDTVTPQVLVMDVLVTMGLIGFALGLAWFWQIARSAGRRCGMMGVFFALSILTANMFQANWNWEIVYVSLGLLVTAPGADPEGLSSWRPAES